MKAVETDHIYQVPLRSGTASGRFEDLYLALRDQERRIYTDREVRNLPRVPSGHVHKKEWAIRAASAKKLCRFLQNKNRPLRILDVGCGNGWLAHRLAQLKDISVTGIDINTTELEQAARVFASVPNLQFINGSLDRLPKENKFDIIVFAASIQYFASFENMIHAGFDLLEENGEIHLVDSMFYAKEEVEAAKVRSADYFRGLGFEKMGKHYFHHSLELLQPFDHTILHDPRKRIHRFFSRSPFYWIQIRKK